MRFVKRIATFAKETISPSLFIMNCRLLKQPINLSKIAIILSIVYLAVSLSLSCCSSLPISRITLHYLDWDFGNNVVNFIDNTLKRIIPLLILPLFFCFATKQNSKASKIAVILYAIHALFSLLIPSIEDTLELRDHYLSNQPWWYEPYMSSAPFRLSLHLLQLISQSLQVAAIGSFAYDNRKNHTTFLIAIAFALFLFAIALFPMCLHTFYEFIELAFKYEISYKTLNACNAINRLHIYIAPVILFAIRNRRNIPLCVSSFVYIPHIFTLGTLLLLGVSGAALITHVLLLGISATIITLFFSKKSYQIDFIGIFIILALSSSITSFLEYQPIAPRTITMLWSIALLASVAIDHLNIKQLSNKLKTYTIASILLSIIISHSMNDIIITIFVK